MSDPMKASTSASDRYSTSWVPLSLKDQTTAGGGTVSYQGATGDVRFDANGDVSAPAVVWSFNDSGTQEVEYLSLAEVDAFISSLK